ncbi:hypothetical protein ACTWQF_31920 [Streptomyces sp. 8N114]|uniref:hypothetical protein n=1 Tax=Streptomyces sp. 8N114 TaxID=3457419 RepID=UPI003FD1BF05
MSRPQHLRRPSGKTKGGSTVDKDDQAVKQQNARRADLLDRMRARLSPPVQPPTGDGANHG